MSAPLSRALALLDLLQTRRTWSGTALCDRLEITDRTLRDLDRLRELGYRIASSRGTGGGYRLEAGSALPPLLLTDDEAVTVAIGLRSVATQGLIDGAQTTLTALAKLEAMLPTRLRRRVSALAQHVEPLAPGTAPVSADLLSELALACRDHERVRFGYTAATGQTSERSVEPHTLVASRRAWFLLAWDRDRDDWRTFRVDRAERLLRTGVRDSARALPAADAAAYVARALGSMWGAAGSAEVVLQMPLAEFQAHAGGYGEGARALDDDRTLWPVDAGSPQRLLSALVWLPAGVRYELCGEPDLLAAVAEIVDNLRAAVGAPG